MNRLASSQLGRLAHSVRVPGYDRSAVQAGVVHLGIGAFHRAHQADVFDQALEAGDSRWGICGASLRSTRVREQLSPQDGLYSLWVRDGERTDLRVIGAVREVLVAPEAPEALVQAIASPRTHLVTLTITEKGYRLDPSTGGLLTQDPDVQSDMGSLLRPRTAPGFLVAGLAARRARGLPPLSVISCDNLPDNGARTRDAVLCIARHHDPGLADWIARHIAFPQTMVDRIVPATTEEDVPDLAVQLGVIDHGMVKTEPFFQWVIENRFSGERPEFEAFGVQITDEVARWEEAKLRLLNGAHSALAYLGGLAGHETLHDVVGQPPYMDYLEQLWDEAAETLTLPPGLDPADYRRALRARFSNRCLAHRTHQIAMDGSQKLPQRLLATCAARIRRDQPIEALALGVAGWMRWQDGMDDAGNHFHVDDPLAGQTRRLPGGQAVRDRGNALMSLREVFPAGLAEDPRFSEPVHAAYARLCHHGARAAVRALVESQ